MNKRLVLQKLFVIMLTGIIIVSIISCSVEQEETVFNEIQPINAENKTVSTETQLDPNEMWWLQPQTYHDGEGPYADFTPEMNITVLHDWSSLLWGYATNPDDYWSMENIQQRWEEAHDKGMRVEAVLSIIDMFFVEYGPEDDIYESSGIDLYGDHIQYDDPIGFVGCTNQHGWQEFTKQKIHQAIDMGVDGIIIDDYEGSSRWTSGVGVGIGGFENGPGGCFCSACEAGFREFLKDKYSTEELASMGIDSIDTFDYSEYLLADGWTIDQLGEESTKFSGWDPDVEINIPFYQDYADLQNQEIGEFIQELKEDALTYAKDKYNKEISWTINASETTYGLHKFYPYFDRIVGGINYFGFPPKGSEGYLYRLSYDIFGTPRLRTLPQADFIVLAAMNEYQTTNLWVLKGAEAYANLGALVEYDYFLFEGSSWEEEDTALQNDPELKERFNTFYLDNSESFDFQSLTSMAKVAVVYSSPSVRYDMYRHTQSFNGICEILTDLHVQFDPIFVGDGISSPDELDMQKLERYELVFLPNVYALTENQDRALAEYLRSGGTIASLGELGVVDAEGQDFSSSEISSLAQDEKSTSDLGNFYNLYEPVSSYGGIDDDYLHDLASFYYQYYIELNHPGVEKFFYLIEEQPSVHIGDDVAADIRTKISQIVDESLSNRITPDILSENIAIQAYQQTGSPQKILLYLVNYDYVLETDTMNDHKNITIAVREPTEFNVSKISVISPDFAEEVTLDFKIEQGYIRFTVPALNMWDVIVIQ